MSYKGKIFFLFLLTLPFGCSREVWQFSTAQGLPTTEKLWRIADVLLYEPGYAQARMLASDWETYTQKITHAEREAHLLDTLANDPTILNFLKEKKPLPSSTLERDTATLLDNFANGALKAWRLRDIYQKTILERDVRRLSSIDTTIVRREIGKRYFTIPITGAGSNYILDGEWDITRLPDFPLSHANSEYLFLTTDKELNVLALGKKGGTFLQDTAWFKNGKFASPLYGLFRGQRIFALHEKDFIFIVVYPFAGILFYIIRAVIFLLLLTAAPVTFIKLKAIRRSAKNASENGSRNWVQEHYAKSLTMNADALKLGDKALGVVSSLKERELQILNEFGKHLTELNTNLSTQTRRILDETATTPQTQPLPRLQPTKKKAPLYKKHVFKEPIRIEGKEGSEVEVSIELDLPLSDEKELSPAEKSTYIGSLRRRAREKMKTGHDYIPDETVENYNFNVEPPLPLPKPKDIPEEKTPKNIDVDAIQNFKYSGKNRVLPIVLPDK
ncbi:MAG: hypothetical protein LDLANPLL_01115 [Turneriella sp.]|nr:hypothetical protein [Turneriella sp.]